LSETRPPPSEEQAESILIEAESAFEAGLIDAARGLYREASSLFTRLVEVAPDEARLGLYLAEASYCDFMVAYCEAVELKENIDRTIMSGGSASPTDTSRLKLLVKLADKCLREAVLRLDKLREKADEEVKKRMNEVVRMIGKKVDAFVELRDEVDVLVR